MKQIHINSPSEPFDERDSVFAREDLAFNPAEYNKYYTTHPELKETDDYFRSLPGLGSKMPATDHGMFYAPASVMFMLGQPDVVDDEPVEKVVPISSAKASEKIRNFSKLLGADLVGFSKLHQNYIYSHVGRIKYPTEAWGQKISLRHKYAISLGFAMDVGLVKTSPRHSEMIGTGIGYLRSALVAVTLAKYIRSLGYPARAHHFRNYQVLPVPLAVEAGLGELARCGFLMTKEYGNCLRLSTVTTDLPLELDRPIDIGVQDFCEMCKLCADACPSGAIPKGDKIIVRGVHKWQLNAEKCLTYWNKIGSDCGMCIASCPWTQEKSWYHSLGSEVAIRSHFGRKLLLWLYPPLFGKFKPSPLPGWLRV